MPQLAPPSGQSLQVLSVHHSLGRSRRGTRPLQELSLSAVFRTSLNHINVTSSTDHDRAFRAVDLPVTLMKMSYAYCPVLEDGGVRWRGFRFGSSTEQVGNAGWRRGVTAVAVYETSGVTMWGASVRFDLAECYRGRSLVWGKNGELCRASGRPQHRR